MRRERRWTTAGATPARELVRIQTFSGGVSEFCVWLGPVATPDREPSVGESVSLFREPDAGNLPVRFDERVVSRRREIVLLYER